MATITVLSQLPYRIGNAMFIKFFCLSLGGLVMLLSWFTRHEIQADETVLFYPTTVVADAGKVSRQVPIHGCVYELELDSIKRQFLLSLLKRTFGISDEQEKSQLFQQRARLFLVDHERGKEPRIKFGAQEYDLGRTGANGHLKTKIEIPDKQLIDPEKVGTGTWLDYQLIQANTNLPAVIGRVRIIPPRGVTIISDIDDTIKLSNVTDKRELLKKTFLEPFTSIKGMPELYAGWSSRGAHFHYLSASPWQLYLPLEEFREREQFPAGVWTLKNVRLTDRTVLDLFGDQRKYKTEALREVLEAQPLRTFVLIGDSGEQDPEIYGDIAREFPKQVRRVFIRQVSTESEKERFERAFRDLHDDVYRVFTEPQTLVDAIPTEFFTPSNK